MLSQRKLLLGLLCLFASAALLVASCSGDSTLVVGSTSSNATTSAGGNGSGGGSGGDVFNTGGNSTVLSIEITPADPTLEVLDGVVTPITLKATGKTQGGGSVEVSGTWSYDRLDIASIGLTSGQVTPTGFVGGSGTVTFDSGSLKATTKVTVKLHFTSDPDGIDQTIKDAFGAAAQADPTLTLLYPYDETVFPRGILGPVLQWSGGAGSETYYLHITSPTFEFEIWGVPQQQRFALPTMPVDIWKKLTDSTEGGIKIELQRHDGNQAYLPVVQNWIIAPANLAGTVYFWEINQGNVVRLKMGSSAPEDFLQKPAGVTCVACHSVAKGGSRIVAGFNGGQSNWGSFDAATGASLYNSGQPSGFQAISPDGEFVLYRHWNQSMTTDGHLILSTYNDATPLAYLNPGGGGPSHPEWSPDGKKIVFSVREEAGGLYFKNSKLWIADVDVIAKSFSNIKKIVDNDATDTVVTYPSFSPGSDWIAVMRGNHAYCDAGAIGQPVYGDIWLTDNSGAIQIKLDTLNGVPVLGAAEQRLNYQPNFLPVAVGGYMWIVFSTERTYGNILTATNASARKKQLWVSAIDLQPQMGQDPSHPAFWLPGQETNNENMRGQWALDPCKEKGNPCEAGYECCSGLICKDDGMGNKSCEEPEVDDCIPTGSSGCETAEDCCDPAASCIGGYCTQPPPT